MPERTWYTLLRALRDAMLVFIRSGLSPVLNDMEARLEKGNGKIKAGA